MKVRRCQTNLIRTLTGFRYLGDWQSACIAGKDAMLGNDGFEFFDHTMLQSKIFKDGLDDHIAVLERFVSQRSQQIRRYFITFEAENQLNRMLRFVTKLTICHTHT